MSRDAYFKNDVHTASAEMLVARLLERAVRCARQARSLDRLRDAKERGPLLRRALDIVAELQTSLDLAQGEIAENLDSLYDFVASRLALAGLDDGDVAIDEALRILDILVDTWRSLPPAGGAAAERGLERLAV